MILNRPVLIPEDDGRRHLMRAGLALSFSWISTSVFALEEKSSSSDGPSEEKAMAERNMQLCSASNSAGVGLAADYFGSDKFTEPPIFSRIDGPVVLDPLEDWKGNRPSAVRWRGWIKPPLSGIYSFHMEHSGVEIKLSQTTIVSNITSYSEPVSLTAGRYYPIIIEATLLSTLSQVAGLEWTAPHGMKFLIPKSLLYIPN